MWGEIPDKDEIIAACDSKKKSFGRTIEFRKTPHHHFFESGDRDYVDTSTFLASTVEPAQPYFQASRSKPYRNPRRGSISMDLYRWYLSSARPPALACHFPNRPTETPPTPATRDMGRRPNWKLGPGLSLTSFLVALGLEALAYRTHARLPLRVREKRF